MQIEYLAQDAEQLVSAAQEIMEEFYYRYNKNDTRFFTPEGYLKIKVREYLKNNWLLKAFVLGEMALTPKEKEAVFISDQRGYSKLFFSTCIDSHILLKKTWKKELQEAVANCMKLNPEHSGA